MSAPTRSTRPPLVLSAPLVAGGQNAHPQTASFFDGVNTVVSLGPVVQDTSANFPANYPAGQYAQMLGYQTDAGSLYVSAQIAGVWTWVQVSGGSGGYWTLSGDALYNNAGTTVVIQNNLIVDTYIIAGTYLILGTYAIIGGALTVGGGPTAIKGACLPTQGEDSGGASAYVVSTVYPMQYTDSMGLLIFAAANASTGASTLALNGGAAAPLTKDGSTALAAGDISAGQILLVATANGGASWQIVG